MNFLILSWRCIKNPAAGGSELYFHELAKRWVSKGHKITWFSPLFPNAKREEIVDGIKIIRSGGRLTVYLAAAREYLSGKLKGKYDSVIDVENGIPFFSPLYIKKSKIFLHIHHVHSNQWFKEIIFPFSFLGYALERYIMPLIYRNRKVITICESSAREIRELRITSKKISIVNPGISFYKKKAIKKNKEPAILFLNRIKKYKGIETFLDCAKIAQEKNKNYIFWVAGDGEYSERAKKIAKDLNLHNVTFLGRITEEKKREYMQKAWVFANPSLKEGWGIVNIEANYAGTPVVGANVGGTRDSVLDEKTGLLFQSENSKALETKIERIASNRRLRRFLERNSIKWAKNFSWDKKAEEYLNLILSK